MHFRIGLALAATALCSTISATSARAASSAFKTRPSYAVEQSSETANLYRINCQMCHGPNGRAPDPAMAFVGRAKWKHGTKTTDMIKVITEGVKGTPMVSFKSKFTAAQIRALARFVRAFDKTLPPE